MAETKCICPVIEIRVTKSQHITDDQAREIANRFNAQVTIGDGSRGVTMWGKHRDECPCASKGERR